MKLFSTLLGLLVLISAGRAQSSETHNFTTYDTSISITPCSYCTPDKWNVRISRPTNMFKAGDPDTASRPAIIMMPGQGELGVNDVSKLVVYGPHYWLNNGWDGGVTLGNGKHYPILITVCYINNVWPTAPSYYNLLTYLLKTYHIKRNSVHLTGLSQGAFTSGALIEFEQTAGDETGMKLVTTLTALEGTPDPLPSPFSTWSRGATAYKVWAKKYGGRYFYLEGSGADNFRDGWQIATPMNDSVPGSAYFSYENLGGGAHCCWNSMYDPNATNWTCAPAAALGPNNAPSQTGKNQMGDYRASSSLFQWMMQHGDTTLVGGGTSTSTPAPTPVANAGADQTITLPTSSITLTGTGTETGGTIKSYAWSQISGPSTATIATSTQAQTTISALIAGTYVLQLKVTDANGATASDQVNVVVKAASSSSSTTTTYQSVPGTIQGESYATMSGVATETTSDAGGGLDVGWISKGDQMTYNLNVASAGTYTVSFRVSSALTGASFKMQDTKGTVLATVNVPNTGGWQTWTTVSASVTLPAGQQTLTIVSLTDNGWNINWMQFALQTTASAPVTSGKAIPGAIQAESYDAMIGVRTETTSDAGGGQDVSYLNSPGNQVVYNVTVAATGTYTATFRVSSPNNGATFKVMDGKNNVLATVTAPNTGGWQVWGNVSASVTLAAGAQTIKVVCQSTSGFNFNWMQFV
ncbi:MAG TPA: carbohydrate-binding protein, partial [Puia sp.]|nr:carbohydrate-binding protein [Puia sp.]